MTAGNTAIVKLSAVILRLRAIALALRGPLQFNHRVFFPIPAGFSTLSLNSFSTDQTQ